MISDLLFEIGFTDKEVSVYLEVLRRGKTTPAVVAKGTGINRATVYSVARTLIEKGVIAGDLGGRSMYLTSLPPEELRTMLDREKRIMARRSAAVNKVIGELSEVSRPQSGPRQYSIPKIRLIDERNLEEYLFKNIDKWNRSALQYDGVHWGYQDHTYVENYQSWIEEFWRRSPEGIKVRLISNRSEIERRMHSKITRDRIIAYWARSINFTATTWVVGDYIVLIYTREAPFYLIELFNPVFAENMREMFKGLWEDVIVRTLPKKNAQKESQPR